MCQNEPLLTNVAEMSSNSKQRNYFYILCLYVMHVLHISDFFFKSLIWITETYGLKLWGTFDYTLMVS